MHMVIRFYRVGDFFYKKNMRFLAKIFWVINRVLFSCDIGIGACIGKNVGFYHNGLGVVVHPRAKIGEGCSVYQNVTIGGNGKEQSKNGVPVVAENVFIGAGSVLMGPIKIGENSIIGANSVINSNVPPGSVVAGNPAKIVAKK